MMDLRIYCKLIKRKKSIWYTHNNDIKNLGKYVFSIYLIKGSNDK